MGKLQYKSDWNQCLKVAVIVLAITLCHSLLQYCHVPSAVILQSQTVVSNSLVLTGLQEIKM